MEKYKDRIALSFGCVEICDFPTSATAFEQYPSGRLIIGDLHGSELVYYRLKVSATVRNRNSKCIRFDDFKAELVAEVTAYVNKAYGRSVKVHGMGGMYRYLNWLLNPNGRYMGQKPGTRIEPINSSLGGFQMFIEFPNLIFFHMHDRVVCRDPNNHEAPTQTYYSRRYEELSTVEVNPETLAHAYPRDGFFGVMRFAGQPYFFSLQVADLPRWNQVADVPRGQSPVWTKERTLSTSMASDDVSIVLHREILKRFTFFRFGVLDRPKDIQVLFKLNDRLNEKPTEVTTFSHN
jgi:hypothetical protein